MSFEDWCTHFTDADVCHIVDSSLTCIQKAWNEALKFGSWTKHDDPVLNRSGGSNRHKTFLQNPQVKLINTFIFFIFIFFCKPKRKEDLNCLLNSPFQYLFDVKNETDEVLITLQQKDQRIHKKAGHGKNLFIGFRVLKVTSIWLYSLSFVTYCQIWPNSTLICLF